jgi:sec-independent protein translocase protein TatB
MFNIGSGEMLVIFLLALLVLGPERLPKAMGQVGRAVAQMRKLSSGFQDEIRRAMDPIEAPFRPGEETLQGPVPAITDEVRVVATEETEPVVLAKADADAETSVEPETGAPVVDDPRPRGTVTPMRPRVLDEDDGGAGDRATG